MHYNTRQYFAASVGIRKTETVARRFFVKKVSLEISQNSQGNTWARVSFLINLQAFLIKLQASARTLLKKRPWRRCFPVNFAKILRTRVLTEHLRWQLMWKASILNAKTDEKHLLVF